MSDEKVREYCEKLIAEKDSLVARYLYETGLKASEICLVERETQTGRVFYPDLKSKHFNEDFDKKYPELNEKE